MVQNTPHGSFAIAGLPQVVQVLAAVVAPTTLVTGLLFYFGFMHAFWFFDYLGVHSTVLGLSTVDYVLRSADALFIPMTVLACAALVGQWAHATLRARLTAGRRPNLARAFVLAAAGVGLSLTLGGLLSVFTPTVLDRQVALAPICLGGGVLLVLYAVRLRRSIRAAAVAADGQPVHQEWVAIAEWAGVFVLVALSLFWAATDYSAAVGRSQAKRYTAGLTRQPDAVLYSERSLRLSAPGVREVRCQDPDAAYQFRYDGLKLVLQSGGQYVFLPEQWSPTNGTAFVIPRTDQLRLEFLAASAATPAPTC